MYKSLNNRAINIISVIKFYPLRMAKVKNTINPLCPPLFQQKADSEKGGLRPISPFIKGILNGLYFYLIH